MQVSNRVENYGMDKLKLRHMRARTCLRCHMMERCLATILKSFFRIDVFIPINLAYGVIGG